MTAKLLSMPSYWQSSGLQVLSIVPLMARRFVARPPVTEMLRTEFSNCQRPRIASLKVRVTVKALPSWLAGAPMVTLGAVVSALMVRVTAVVLALLVAASVLNSLV